MPDKEKLSWVDIETATSNLLTKIKSSNVEYDCILGIANGGLIPTCLIAKGLGIKKVLTVSVKAYIDENAHDVQFITSLNHWDFKGRSNVLIVDDLIDRGETVFEVEKILSYFSHNHELNFNYDTAVLYLKKSDSVTPRVDPKYYSEIKDPESWLVFPWE